MAVDTTAGVHPGNKFPLRFLFVPQEQAVAVSRAATATLRFSAQIRRPFGNPTVQCDICESLDVQ